MMEGSTKRGRREEGQERGRVKWKLVKEEWNWREKREVVEEKRSEEEQLERVAVWEAEEKS